MKLWLTRLLPLGIVAAALLLAFAMTASRPQHEKQPRVHPRPAVDVTQVQFEPLQLYVKSQGTVTPRKQIEWASEVSGRVIWVSPQFVDGNAVAAGAPLLRLDDTEYRAAVANAESALADARLALAEERAETRRGNAYRAQHSDADSSNLRQPKMQQVEAQEAAAREQLKKARQDLARTEISAPFAGVIANKAVDLGQYVSGGSVLFELLGTEVAEVRLPVTAGDIGFIDHAAIGTDAPPKVRLQAVLGSEAQVWEATLVRTERRVDPDMRTFNVIAEVKRPYDKSLHPTPLVLGMYVDARIDGRLLPAGMRLPRNAIHDDRYVYLVRDGQLKRQPIPIYRHEHDSVILTQGIEEGDRVAVNRLELMVDGMEVTPVAVDSAAREPAVAAGEALQ